MIDVLYSAAGNSADEAYYSNGIIGYDFEIGATHYNENYDPDDPTKGTRPAAPASSRRSAPSDQRLPDNEGFHEAMEFADGNYGLLRSALDYANDTTAPVVAGDRAATVANVTQNVRFTSNEAASIYYTTDGSTPTTASTEWKPNRAAGAAAAGGDRRRRHAEVDRDGLQGQRLGGGVEDVHDRDRQADGDPHRVHRGRRCSRSGRPVPVQFTCADEAGGSGIDELRRLDGERACSTPARRARSPTR